MRRSFKVLPARSGGRGTSRRLVEGAAQPALTRRPSTASGGPPPHLRWGGLLALTLLASPALAQTIAFTGGTVAIGDGSQPIPNGTVVIRDGRVIAAGANVAVPAGAQVVDATGKWVSPGIVAGFTNLSITDGEGIEETYDAAAGHATFSAAIDIAPAVNLESPEIGNERAAGVTRAIVSPEASTAIFAGEGAVVGLGKGGQAITRQHAFQYVELGEEGAKRAGGSRPAAYAALRDAFAAARAYRDNPRAFAAQDSTALTKVGDAQALLQVLDGKVPLAVHVERAPDILAVLQLKQAYPGIRLVLIGATEGWEVAPQIAAAHVPVIAAALADLPEEFERVAATESNVGRLRAAGVTVGISTVDASAPADQHNVKQFAGNLVAIAKVPGAVGLDWGAAFATITSKPAEALGMDGEIGSLRPGRHADVVLWDGDPLELSSWPTAVYIDGVPQPMRTRQIELRDRYMNPTPGALPKAYER